MQNNKKDLQKTGSTIKIEKLEIRDYLMTLMNLL